MPESVKRSSQAETRSRRTRHAHRPLRRRELRPLPERFPGRTHRAGDPGHRPVLHHHDPAGAQGHRRLDHRGVAGAAAGGERGVRSLPERGCWKGPLEGKGNPLAQEGYKRSFPNPMKATPPACPLNRGQEKAKPPLTGGDASPFYTPLSRGGRGGWFSGQGNDERAAFSSGIPLGMPGPSRGEWFLSLIRWFRTPNHETGFFNNPVSGGILRFGAYEGGSS